MENREWKIENGKLKVSGIFLPKVEKYYL